MWDLEVLYKEGNDTFKFLQKKEKEKVTPASMSGVLFCLGILGSSVFFFQWSERIMGTGGS